MAVFEDLGPIDYFPVADASALRAIGWLGRGREFPRGEVSREFFEKLCALLIDPWQPMASAGISPCDLCQFSGGPGRLRVGEVTVALGSANLFVPGRGFIYVAPSLVAHYIDAHGYRPPEEFIEAVLSCPPMRSMDFKRLLLANGGRSLLA